MNERMNENYIIPATSRLIRHRITVSRSNRSIQQRRQAISDVLIQTPTQNWQEEHELCIEARDAQHLWLKTQEVLKQAVSKE